MQTEIVYSVFGTRLNTRATICAAGSGYRVDKNDKNKNLLTFLSAQTNVPDKYPEIFRVLSFFFFCSMLKKMIWFIFAYNANNFEK